MMDFRAERIQSDILNIPLLSKLTDCIIECNVGQSFLAVKCKISGAFQNGVVWTAGAAAWNRELVGE